MKHHRAIMTLHWLTVLLVAAGFAIAVAHENIEDSESRRFWLDMHRSLGLLVLAVVFLRAVARVTWGREPVNELPLGLRVVSAIGHAMLYATLIALPLLGWAQSSARSRHFTVFNITLPSLAAHDADRADMFGSWHAVLAWTFLALIGLHAAAALWHHHVRRDDVLRSMLPSVRERNSPRTVTSHTQRPP